MQAIQSIGCTASKPDCPASVPLSQYPGIGGTSLKAIFGVGLRPNNAFIGGLTSLGIKAWIVNLPLPGSSSQGSLILNPTASDIAGYTLFQLSKDGTGWDDTQIPTCLTNLTTGKSFCHTMLVDSGGSSIGMVSSAISSDISWPAGTQGTMVFTNAQGTALNASFTVEPNTPSAVALTTAASGITLNNTGPTPFYTFSVYYDPVDGLIGLKER
jgi:hypothetical protein